MNCEAALALASERFNKKPFHSEPLTSQGELEKKLELAEIVDFGEAQAYTSLIRG